LLRVIIIIIYIYIIKLRLNSDFKDTVIVVCLAIKGFIIVSTNQLDSIIIFILNNMIDF
jgi:hypothetical protein